jgi:HlyD family secretion protein
MKTMKKSKKIVIAMAILAVAAIAILVLLPFGGKEEVTLRTVSAREGELELTVTASGHIQPVTKVEVGTQVSGIVKRIHVDFNSQVTTGQLLAELDKSTLSERVRQAEASLANADSDRKLAQQNYDRTKSLFDQKAATPASLEEAENRLSTANGRMVTAKADLQQAMVNLAFADIYSPISGRVLNRAVDEGQTVAASFSTPTLFTIANDLTKMQVEANVDEADIGRIRVGQSSEFSVDTYPGEIFTGTVSQIRLEPQVASNVVTYTVIIEAPNPEEKLFPGMTANVTITTQSPEGICVLTEALYFTPDPAQFKGYRIENVETKGNRLWIMTGDVLRAVEVTAGASDGVETIILSGIRANDNIVIGVEKASYVSGSGLFPGPPQGGGSRPAMMQ